MAGDNREERQARSLALERAYVHDVYDRIAHHFADTLYRPWPRVRQFLEDLEPGSLVADIGCGNGKYLDINPDVMKIGLEYCATLCAAARSRGGGERREVLTCDALRLPFRDETFDAVISVAVIHHFATTERRVAAIKEMTRATRIGGKVLITVWAMEQRHRKFDSQDVLVPWHEPVKSSSGEDRGSSVERELTSTTTSDDDVLVYHAYSHISDGEGTHQAHAKKKLRYRNGHQRGRYRSSDHPGSQSSSELSSPNETCYSFVRRAFQKLSSSSTTGTGPYGDSFSRKNNSRPYFYRSCRKPCISDSMEFGSNTCKDTSRPSSPRNEFHKQDSIESEYPDHEDENDIPIEIRHLEGYETCKNCGSPEFGNCEGGGHVCTVCLPPASSDSSDGKKSRSLVDFLNMIPKLLRVKKCEKEPLSADLHKRISTASDPREYVVKTRGANVNGIVRSKSTVSFMSRLEELMSMSASSGGKDEQVTVANPNCSAGPRSKSKPHRLPSLNSPMLIEGCDGTISILKSNNDTGKDNGEIDKNNTSPNPPRHISPADALRKLRQDMSLDESLSSESKEGEDKEDTSSSCSEKKLQNSELSLTDKSLVSSENEPQKDAKSATSDESLDNKSTDGVVVPVEEGTSDPQQLKVDNTSEGYLSSYYSMPELYKLTDDEIPEDSIFNVQRQKTISFLEQAQNILGDVTNNSNDLTSTNENSSLGTLNYRAMERCVNIPQRGLVKRSLSVDTGDNTSASHQVPRRFSASAAQGVLASALRTYTLPRSCSRGSSVKSDTSVDSEESIVSVIPRKGNSITSDTSVDSEESVISVIQRSTSDIDTFGNQNGLRNISRFGSRSAQASPVTVLSSQTSSAESSPPQSGKNDGRFPGNAAVIDQLMMQHQQNMLCSQVESMYGRHEISEHGLRTRRCLLRPISDPRIEEKLSFHASEDVSSVSATKRPSSVEETKISRSFELGETKSQERKEQYLANLRKFSSSDSAKPLLNGLDTNEHVEQKDAEGELSRTPSPVGPIKYITDPLITGIDISSTSNSNATNETESKTKCLRFDSDVTDIEQKKTSPNSTLNRTSTENLSSALKSSGKKDDYNALEKNVQSSSSSLEHPNISKSPVPEDCSTTPKESNYSKGSDSEVRKSLFKLRERLESLTSSQSSGQGFDLFKNVSHTIQGIGSLKNIKERIDSETTNVTTSSSDTNKECKVSPTPKSLNDSRQSSLDESSLVTLSDESVMSVEGTTSSVSDEANDYKRTDDDDDIDSSQNITVRKATDVDKCIPGTSGKASQNVLTETGQGGVTHSKLDSIVENGLPTLHRQPKPPSFSDTELHSRKGVARCSLRKRLRRSCVTIDEVECRDFISSEDTSPSSSVSLEWNDFDKIETDSSSGAGAVSAGACCCKSVTTGTATAGEVQVCCDDDVNVAAANEAETKFNVFGDKEMCVFFETPPSSSIGKSASSSSNATDFSTTSDRFMRGVMQREKSDDRSSKESDSDNNLSTKLSDVDGPRSDSAFSSEDFARRTTLDGVSSSSSQASSLDVLDSMLAARAKLSGCEYEMSSATKVKQTSNWVLHNIDEIPDDQNNEGEMGEREGEQGQAKSPTPSTSSWSNEGVSSMDVAQKREKFLNNKLSDIEAPRSDSAFTSEDLTKTKRTVADAASSSSSATSSFDILDSMLAARERLTGCMDTEYEMSTAAKVKQTSNWVLHNIDEIPDDHNNEDQMKSPTPSTSSMDLAQKQNFLSSANDCRDMYRISFDGKSKAAKEREGGSAAKENTKQDSKDPVPVAGTSKDNAGSVGAESRGNPPASASRLNGTVGMRVPELAPEVLQLFPRKSRPAENEGHTDILAAFVETISDLTAVFQELYPRQESKYEDMSSDESAVEISSFERILTSSDLPSERTIKQNEVVEPKENKESKGVDANTDKRPADDPKKSINNESAYNNTSAINNTFSSKKSSLSHFNIGQTFVKLPPEQDSSKNHHKPNDKRKSLSEDHKGRQIDSSNKHSKPNNVDHLKSSEKDRIPANSVKDPQKLSNLDKKDVQKPVQKTLNRSSQSVCLERMRQDSEESTQSNMSTQSAPCSPRMKPPRQRSVEEVMSSSRTAELSRGSSLSQSTSQESLPGNEASSGGLMSCHRYYHVFRQGELDSLIENHVDNLHIISSYYDHANWCVVAEKVQVWTI